MDLSAPYQTESHSLEQGTIYHGEQEIKTGTLGLDTRLSIYNAEIYALAKGATMTWKLITDNQAAVISITDTSAHMMQAAFIIFHKHADLLLANHPDLHIEIIWTSSHYGLPGNNRADTLAKTATFLPALIHSTIA